MQTDDLTEYLTDCGLQFLTLPSIGMTSVCHRSQLTITFCELNSISTRSITANCLLKHKAMDSEKHPDFLLFGGSGVGHRRGRDGWRQPRRNSSSTYPCCFPGQPGSRSLNTPCHTAVNAQCGLEGKDGKDKSYRG